MARKPPPFEKTPLGKKDAKADRMLGIKAGSKADQKMDRLVQRNAQKKGKR